MARLEGFACQRRSGASAVRTVVDIAASDRQWPRVTAPGFALGVEDQLGVFTQVATPGGLKERIRDRVLREAVAL